MLEIASNFTEEDYRVDRNAVSKLKMMYKGFLPYAVLAEYVSFVLENEMLTYRKYDVQKRDFVFCTFTVNCVK
jgi:hypothetical protein